MFTRCLELRDLLALQRYSIVDRILHYSVWLGTPLPPVLSCYIFKHQDALPPNKKLRTLLQRTATPGPFRPPQRQNVMADAKYKIKTNPPPPTFFAITVEEGRSGIFRAFLIYYLSIAPVSILLSLFPFPFIPTSVFFYFSLCLLLFSFLHVPLYQPDECAYLLIFYCIPSRYLLSKFIFIV